MSDEVIVFVVIGQVIAGLLIGRALWAIRLAHRENLPNIVEHRRILDDAKRVQLDVDELTRRDCNG